MALNCLTYSLLSAGFSPRSHAPRSRNAREIWSLGSRSPSKSASRATPISIAQSIDEVAARALFKRSKGTLSFFFRLFGNLFQAWTAATIRSPCSAALANGRRAFRCDQRSQEKCPHIGVSGVDDIQCATGNIAVSVAAAITSSDSTSASIEFGNSIGVATIFGSTL